MMIFRLGSAIGVAAVAGSVALVGAALALGLALTEAEAPALAEVLGEPVSSTKVVVLVLSPPHPASTTAIRTDSPAPNPFITTELGALYVAPQ
jgi:hypothetical protein